MLHTMMRGVLHSMHTGMTRNISSPLGKLATDFCEQRFGIPRV